MDACVYGRGVRGYEVPGFGMLRFDPADPKVYVRFLEMPEKLRHMKAELVRVASEAEDTGGKAQWSFREAELRVKRLLADVFGPGNDPDRLLAELELFSPTEDDRYGFRELTVALEKILTQGAKICVRQEIEQALAEAGREREALMENVFYDRSGGRWG